MKNRDSQVGLALSQSLQAIQEYQNLLASHSVQTPETQKSGTAQRVLQNLINSLENMRALLSKERDENRFTPVEPHIVAAVNKAFNELLEDATIDNKINYVHFALYGANVPFWSVLREVQQLLYTVEGLKEKSKKIARIDRLDQAKEKER